MSDQRGIGQRQARPTPLDGASRMRAVCWNGKRDIRVEDVPMPQILNPRDAIVKVTSTAICGSDLHLYDGFIPTMRPGDILGHEFMGEVVEVGRPHVDALAVGDRVVVPFAIACGRASSASDALVALRQLEPQRLDGGEALWLLRLGPLRLLAHLRRLCRRAGRVRPRAVRRRGAASKVPPALSRRAGAVPVRHLPHRLHGRRELQHPPGDTVAVWGCGPVGLSSRSSARTCSAPSA